MPVIDHKDAPSWPDSVGPMWSRMPFGTIPDVVLPLLERDRNAPALTFEDGLEVSCGTLLTEVRRFTTHLRGRIRPGDRVVVAVGNRAEFFVAWLAVLAAGGVAVKVNPAIGTADAAHIVEDSGAVLAVCEQIAVDALEQATRSRDKLVVLDGAEPFGFAGLPADLSPLAPAFAGPSVTDHAGLTYTSGTTGPPKGCVHDHRQYLRYADLKLRLFDYRSDDVILNPLRFYYGDSIWLWLASLGVGARFISMRKFSVSRFWPTVRRFGVTTFLGIGAIPNLLLKAQPHPQDRDHSVRFAAQIGVPPDRHRELVDRFGFPWVEGYGLSECGSAIAMPMGAGAAYIGTGAIGIPVPEVDVALTDGSGQELTGPAAGQLLVRTPDMMCGYLNRPEATSEVLRDGWLRTGDLARRDDDGVYYFVGRSKLIIRRGGENIAPEEVEAVLRLHPTVLDAAVVPIPDELRGEEVMAYVELTPATAFDPAALTAFCANRLSAFKVPRYLRHRTHPFPRTPSMRIKKSELTVHGRHETDGAWDRTPR